MKSWISQFTMDYCKLAKNESEYAMLIIKDVLATEPELLMNNLEFWVYLSENNSDGAIDILLDNPDKINGNSITINTNPRVEQILRDNPEYINWYFLSYSKFDYAFDILRENPENICWEFMSKNDADNAYQLLCENKDKIDWIQICLNKNEKSVQLLKDKMIEEGFIDICWLYLSKNPTDVAVDILLENPDNICWENFSSNCNHRAYKFLCDTKNYHKRCYMSITLNTLPEALESIEDFIMKSQMMSLLYKNDSPFAFEIIRKYFKKMKNDKNVIFRLNILIQDLSILKLFQYELIQLIEEEFIDRIDEIKTGYYLFSNPYIFDNYQNILK
jgi:hypothetical protein